MVQQRSGRDYQLALISPAGGDLTLLTDDPAYNAFPTWSPDGAALAFVRDPGGLTESDKSGWRISTIAPVPGASFGPINGVQVSGAEPDWGPAPPAGD